MEGKAPRASWILIFFSILISSAPFTGLLTPVEEAGQRALVSEGQDNDGSNNDDFATAQDLVRGDFLDGTTALGDTHRIDVYAIRNVSPGKIINASLQITNFNNQAILVTGWNKFHMDILAWSNDESNPVRRAWEAISFLCVVTGDYYIQVKPLGGSGAINYRLEAEVSDAEDITAKVGTGGAFGPYLTGNVSSDKWYPARWYRLQMSGELGGMNDYLYANLTLPGAPSERLLADLYAINMEPESWSNWLNHSWWLDSQVQNEEVHASACYPGTSWYYILVQAFNSTGGRSEYYELRLTRTSIMSDGDNHPRNATPVCPEPGKTTVRKQGDVVRGPDMFDWHRVYLYADEGVAANLTLNEKSMAIFRLSIYRDNLTNGEYDLMSSWTNKPAQSVLNRINLLATNVSQEGWYYIGVIAQIGLMPSNVNTLADWTVQSAWAKYTLDITLPVAWSPPVVKNEPGQITFPEDGSDSSLRLNYTGANNGVFFDNDFQRAGERLNFTSSFHPFIDVSIASTEADPGATVTMRPKKDWNGDADITFTATDLEGTTCSVVAHVQVTPVSDPPFIKAALPAFCVLEGAVNCSMKELRLPDHFSDPDFAPFGEDCLAFSVDNSSFPARVECDRLVFGPAPDYPGSNNTTIMLTVTATDREALTICQTMNITVLDNSTPPPPPDRPPVFNEGASEIEIMEDTYRNADLHNFFYDPDGDPLNFSYLGGASPNLTVILLPTGTLSLMPAPNYYTAREALVLRATDPQGLTATGELDVRIININDPPHFVDGSIMPAPGNEIRVDEGGSAAFRFAAADIDNSTSQLRSGWTVDGKDMAVGGWDLTWFAGYNDSGSHAVRAWVSDGLATIELVWQVTVMDINRPPVILEVLPRNGTAYPPGSLIDFRASAMDPDGDRLEFVWSYPNGTELKRESGTSSSFTRRLPDGNRYDIILNVSDGKGGAASTSFSVEVAKNPVPTVTTSNDWTPTYLIAGIIIIAAAVTGIAAVGRWRRRKGA